MKKYILLIFIFCPCSLLLLLNSVYLKGTSIESDASLPPEITGDCPVYTKEFNANKDSFRIVINNCASKYFYANTNDENCQFGLLPVVRGNKWGYYNLNACREIGSCTFDSVSVFKAAETGNDDTIYSAKVIYQGQELKINEQGQFVFNALDLSIYSKNGKKGLRYISDDGTIKLTITPAVYDNLDVEDLMSSTEGYGIFIAKKAGKYGLINVVGKEALPIEYDKIDVPEIESSDVYFAFIKKDRKTGICNKTGKILVPVEYDKINFYAITGILDDGIVRFAVTKDGKEGMYEVSKGLTFPCIYDEVYFVDSDGDNGEALVARTKKIIGIYPPPNSTKKPDEGYETILPLVEGLRLAKKNGKWGAVNTKSEVVVAFNYQDIKYVDYKYLWVQQKGKWGRIDRQGNFIIPPAYDDVKGQQAPFISVMEKKYWGLINEKGEPKTAFIYSRLGYNFDRKLWIINYKNKEGLLTDDAKEYLAPNYDRIAEIFDEYIIVEKNGLTGVIDHKGNMIIDFKYSKIVPIKEGRFSAMIKKKYGIIDSQSNTIIPFEFEDIYPLGSDFIVQKQKLKGLYSKDGKPILQIQFDKIIDFKDGIAKVVKEGKTRWVDEKGREYNENPSKKKGRKKQGAEKN